MDPALAVAHAHAPHNTAPGHAGVDHGDVVGELRLKNAVEVFAAAHADEAVGVCQPCEHAHLIVVLELRTRRHRTSAAPRSSSSLFLVLSCSGAVHNTQATCVTDTIKPKAREAAVKAPREKPPFQKGSASLGSGDYHAAAERARVNREEHRGEWGVELTAAGITDAGRATAEDQSDVVRLLLRVGRPRGWTPSLAMEPARPVFTVICKRLRVP